MDRIVWGAPFEWVIFICLVTIYYVGLYVFKQQYNEDMKDVRVAKKCGKFKTGEHNAKKK